MTHTPVKTKFERSESANHWHKTLQAKMVPQWSQEIDEFETELFLKKQGKIEDKIFAETRLRRGAYGQRYDNGFRHDGREKKAIPFPAQGLTKGPDTAWDAPGMERIKIPYGGMTPEQMDVMADLAEEYSDSICHITTRQDIQLHFVHIEDTPSIFRRLASVGITTREACGNSVRNITACPIAGTCHTESFDVTAYADAMFHFLLGHPDVQDFGRKFKIAFSGCKQNACGLANMHDLGLVAVSKNENGKVKRGFEFFVGGGLGAVPHSAKLFSDFVPEEELLPLTQAVSRIFARYGEKKNRNRARIKFLVADWGIDKFRDAVLEERKKIQPDARWTAFLSRLHDLDEAPKSVGANNHLPLQSDDPEFNLWFKNNVQPQKQEGYSIVTMALPLGDIASNQMRDLANIARKFTKGTVRTTVEQNIVLRWIANSDLVELHKALKVIHLADPVYGTIVDIVSCPGTDTCKLGVSASRGLAGELKERLAEKSYKMDEAIKKLHIKVSGCFNSCGQHHLSDIGFYGISRKVGGYIVPHFQVVLGGHWEENGGSYGLAVVGVPSKAAPLVVDRLADMYLKGKQSNENFQAFIKRLGKVEIKKALDDLTKVPDYTVDKSYYTDWGDVREFTNTDIGKGECAGEVVSLVDFGLKAADREVFEAQVALEAAQWDKAAELAFKAMVTAAQGLIKGKNPDISNDANIIIDEFRKMFCDTQIFYDPFAGAKFAQHLFMAESQGTKGLRPEQVRQRVEEAQLFIEAAYSCHVRMSMQPVG
ncbi:MAG TPA: sulfite reductase [Deltaproteobacteria bacterium]|nr:sulfite reductase [Deltaproteobacteria bacterium]